MKKLLSLLLCLALLAGLFAVSAAADEAGEPAEKPAGEEDFIAAVGAQAFAVTMAAWLGDAGEGVSLDDPAFLWDAAGWYAAWLYRTDGCDLLSPEDAADFLRSLGAEDCAMPEGWTEYGVVRVLHGLDGSEHYDFQQHKAEIDEMLGVNTLLSFVGGEGGHLTTVLSCFYEDELSAEWMYELAFEEAGEAVFPYRLTGMRLLDKGPQMDGELSFSWDELLEANRLENVLAHYPAVYVALQTEQGEPDELSGNWLFESGGELARVSCGEDYVGGEYRGCYFEFETAEDGAERAVVGRIAGDGESEAFLSGYLTAYLQNVVIVQLEKEEDDLIWLGCTFRGGYRERIAVDRGTLVLRVIDFSSGDMLPPSVLRFEYMKPAPDYPFLKSWDGALRTVTTVWEEYVLDEETHEWASVVRTDFARLPADWEYLPYQARWGEYTAYLNEGYTEPYVYPGDGVDYTLYLTTAKG